jgi:hypothetical protein
MVVSSIWSKQSRVDSLSRVIYLPVQKALEQAHIRSAAMVPFFVFMTHVLMLNYFNDLNGL